MVSAESAWRHYSDKLGLKSVGVMAVTEAECISEDLSVTPDPKPDHGAHVLLGFGGLTRSAIRKAAGSLANAANARGWCYRPDGHGA